MEGGGRGFTGTLQRRVPKRDKGHQVAIYGSATKMKIFKILTIYPQYATDILDMGGLPSLLDS